MSDTVFPPGYPENLKKYGYPPGFSAGYAPEQFEKYGYPPSNTPRHPCQNNPRPSNTDPSSNSGQSSSIVPRIEGSVRDYGIVNFPWGAGSYVPIAGNVYNSGFNVNHSGTQISGDVNVGNANHTSE